jgi:PAS domain S-box-containing protein
MTAGDTLTPPSHPAEMSPPLPNPWLFFQGLGEGILVQDIDRRVVFANDAAAHLCGFETAAEMLATPISEVLQRFTLFDEVGAPFSLNQLPAQRAFAGETVPEMTLRWRIVATGEERWSNVKATPVLDAGGSVRFILSLFRDVTERKRDETRQRLLVEASTLLAESLDYEQTLRQVANLAVPGVADWCGVDILDASGVLIPIAVGHIDPNKVALGLEVRRRYPPDPNNLNGAAAVLRTGKPHLVTEIPDALLAAVAVDTDHLAMLRALGLHSMMTVPLIARGRGLGTLTFVSSDPAHSFGQEDLAFAEELGRRAAVAIDNSRLYRELAVAETRYHSLFEGTADAILVFDAAGNYIDANEAAISLYRESREELLARQIGDTPEMRAQSLESFARLTKEGTFQGEMLLQRRDGTTVPIEARTTAIPLPDGTIYVSVLRDITERRQAEEERLRFIAMVAHELRNPLTTIIGFAQLLRRRERYDAARMDTIITQAGRLERLTLDLREMIRAEAHGYDLKRAPLDVRAVVQAIVEQAQVTTEDHTIQLSMPDVLAPAVWDCARIEQIMGNLLANAIRYAPDGGDIRVHVEEEADAIHIAVSDPGIGIPPEALPRVFEPFYRAVNAQQGSARGMGLGLAITKALVEAHGGQIEAASTPGEGTTITVSIPHDIGGARP